MSAAGTQVQERIVRLYVINLYDQTDDVSQIHLDPTAPNVLSFNVHPHDPVKDIRNLIAQRLPQCADISKQRLLYLNAIERKQDSHVDRSCEATRHEKSHEPNEAKSDAPERDMRSSQSSSIPGPEQAVASSSQGSTTNGSPTPCAETTSTSKGCENVSSSRSSLLAKLIGSNNSDEDDEAEDEDENGLPKTRFIPNSQTKSGTAPKSKTALLLMRNRARASAWRPKTTLSPLEDIPFHDVRIVDTAPERSCDLALASSGDENAITGTDPTQCAESSNAAPTSKPRLWSTFGFDGDWVSRADIWLLLKQSKRYTDEIRQLPDQLGPKVEDKRNVEAHDTHANPESSSL